MTPNSGGQLAAISLLFGVLQPSYGSPIGMVMSSKVIIYVRNGSGCPIKKSSRFFLFLTERSPSNSKDSLVAFQYTVRFLFVK